MNVLVLEDEALLAIDLADMIETLGHTVIGPFSVLQEAMDACEETTPDLALLDFNLGKGTSEVLADRLVEKGVPFAFLTGYSTRHIPDRYSDRTILEKPIMDWQLEAFLKAAPHDKAPSVMEPRSIR